MVDIKNVRLERLIISLKLIMYYFLGCQRSIVIFSLTCVRLVATEWCIWIWSYSIFWLHLYFMKYVYLYVCVCVCIGAYSIWVDVYSKMHFREDEIFLQMCNQVLVLDVHTSAKYCSIIIWFMMIVPQSFLIYNQDILYMET